MYYVYFLQNAKGEIYFGSTNNLKRRLQEHNSGHSPHTKGSLWRLPYYEAYSNESDARNREIQLKNHGNALAHLKRRISNSLRQNSAG